MTNDKLMEMLTEIYKDVNSNPLKGALLELILISFEEILKSLGKLNKEVLNNEKGK